MKTGTPPAKAESAPKPADEIVHQLALASCHISERNTRQPKPKEPGIIELARSIKEHGQTTAAIVRPHPKKKGEYEIGAGARRRVACEVAGVGTLGAVIRSLDDTAFEELILVENLQREDPDPRAEIELIDRLVKRGIHTPDQISAHLGKPPHWAKRRLQMLKIVPEIRSEWNRPGQNGLGHFSVDMMALVGSLPPETQKGLLKDRYDWEFRRCSSRADLQKYLEREVLCVLDKAPFDLNDPRFFVKGSGPGCACSSAAVDGLFDFGDKPKAARCLNVGCFKQRLQLANKAKLAAIKKERGDLPIVTSGHDDSRSGNDQIAMFGKIISPHSVESWSGEKLLNEETKGAKKVVVWSPSKSTLRVAWLQQTGHGSNGSKKLKTPGAGLAERKRILQGKRLILVHDELVKALDAAKHTEATENVIDLVAIFGLPFKAEMCYGDMKPWKKFDARAKEGWPVHPHYEMYRPTKSLPPVKHRAAALWHGVCTVMKSIMKPIGNVGAAGRYEPMMRRVAKLIKFPFDTKKKEADLKIPPPKSWGPVDVHTLEPVKSSASFSRPGKTIAERDASRKTSNVQRSTSNVQVGKKKASGGGLTLAMRNKLSAAMKARWAARRKIATKK